MPKRSPEPEPSSDEQDVEGEDSDFADESIPGNDEDEEEDDDEEIDGEEETYEKVWSSCSILVTVSCVCFFAGNCRRLRSLSTRRI